MGALALALGVGFAVTTAPGVAWAGPDTENGGTETGPNNPGAQTGTNTDAVNDPPAHVNSPSSGPANVPAPLAGPGIVQGGTTTVGSQSQTVVDGDGPTVVIRHQGTTGVSGGTTPTEEPPTPTQQQVPVAVTPSPTAGPTAPPTPPPAQSAANDGALSTADPKPQPDATSSPTNPPVIQGDDGAGFPALVTTTMSGSPNASVGVVPVETVNAFSTLRVAGDPGAGAAGMALRASSSRDAIAPVAVSPQPNPIEAVLAIPVAVIKVAADLLTAVLTPFIGSGPTAPQGDPPLLWAVLAFVRRQFFNDGPSISETVGAPDADGNIKITLNATDADGDTLVYTATGATKGTVTRGADGHTFTYDPNAGATGTETITITASDATNTHLHGLAAIFSPDGGHSVTKQLVLTIPTPTQPNDRPPTLTLPAAGSLTPGANGDIVFSISGTDPDGGPVTFSAATNQGSLVQQGPGTFTYSPGSYAHSLSAETYTGPLTAAVTVTATDSTGRTTTSVLNLPVTPINIKPVATGAATVGSPNAAGVVPLSFVVTDGDGDAITYTDDSAKGDVSIVNGQLIFTPSYSARHAAAADGATAADKKATFTLTASDGHSGTVSSVVTVDIDAPGIVSTVTVPGRAVGGLQYTADGTRAIQTTQESVYTEDSVTTVSRVVVIDTATGQQVGATTAIPGLVRSEYGYGTVRPAQLSADGSRAVLVTRETSYANGAYAYVTRIAVVDTATGNQVGSTITLDGVEALTQFNADGTRLAHAASVLVVPDGVPNYASKVVVVDTSSGNQVGATTTVAGTITAAALSADGGSIVVTSVQRTEDATTDAYTYTTRVTDVDLSTGTQIGSTTTSASYSNGSEGSTQYTADGTRSVRTTSVRESGEYVIRVTVTDLQTGLQMGPTATLPGFGSTQLAADGLRAVVTASAYDYGINGYVTRVVVLDTETGERMGDVIEQRGSAQAKLTPDGIRAVLSTGESRYDSATRNYVETTRITIIDTRTGAQVGSTIVAAGTTRETVITADGTRVLQTTGSYDSRTGTTTTTRVVIVNALTGTQVGDTIVLTGGPESTTLYDDDTRAIQYTRVETKLNGGSSTYVTGVSIVDLVNGAQLGTTTTLAGNDVRTLFSPDGTRIVAISSDYDRTSSAEITQIAVIDAATGSQIGSTTQVFGTEDRRGPGSTYYERSVFTPDGTRLVQTTSGYERGTGATTTRMVVVDLATGQQVGTAAITAGNPSGALQFIGGGARAVQTTIAYGQAAGGYATHVTVLDVATGAKVSSAELAGYSQGALQFSADETRVFATSSSDSDTGASSARVSVIDVATGRVLAVSPAVPGDAVGAAALSADGTRVVLTTTVYDRTIYTSTTSITEIDIDYAGFNERPTVATGAPTVGSPDADGIVTGAVRLTDPDGDTLTYGGSGGTPKGSVVVNADGSFTYTPNEAARLAAARVDATADQKRDVVTIFGFDGHGGVTTTQVTVALLALNTAPQANSTLADFTDGVLTGRTIGSDVDGDSLTYAVAAQGSSGTAAIDARTGVFTYTPSAAGRTAASTTPGVDYDTFTVTVDDGQGNITDSVITVEVLQNGVVTDSAVQLPPWSAMQYSPDGTRGIRVAITEVPRNSNDPYDPETRKYTTSVAVIDTATGRQIGETAVFESRSYDSYYSANGLVYSSDGAYAALTTRGRTRTGDVYSSTTQVTVIDTATGAISTTTIAGTPGIATFTPDGRRVLQYGTVTTAGSDANGRYTEVYQSELAIIDTRTGAVTRVQIPAKLSDVDDYYSYRQIDLDPTGATAILRTKESYSNLTTSVVFVDVATGAITTFSQAGYDYSPQFNEDRTRLVVRSSLTNTGGTIAGIRIAILDTTTGRQVGSTLEGTGTDYSYASIAQDNRLILTDVVTSQSGTTTRLTAFDLRTGTQIGDTISVAGQSYSLAYSPDRSRAIVTTSTSGSITMIDTATFTQVGSTLAIGGGTTNAYTSAFRADGRQAVVAFQDYSTTGSTRFVVVDTVTGTQVGGVVTVTGHGGAQYNVDGSRVVISTNDSTSGSTGNTRIVVLDAATGVRIGTTTTLLGSASTILNASGTRATVIATTYENGAYTGTRVAFVDLTTGTQVGSTTELAGYGYAQRGVSNDRIVLTTQETDAAGNKSTRVILLNVETGTAVGSTFTQAGRGYAQFSTDGSRILVQSDGYDTPDHQVRFSVLDAVTGAQIGSTVAVAGQGAVQVNADQTRAILVGNSDDRTVGTVAVVDVATGTQIGDSLTLRGPLSNSYVLLASGDTRAVLVSNPDYYSSERDVRVTLLDTDTGAAETYALKSRGIMGLRLTPDGHGLLIDSYDDSYDYQNPGVRNRATVIAL